MVLRDRHCRQTKGKEKGKAKGLPGVNDRSGLFAGISGEGIVSIG